MLTLEEYKYSRKYPETNNIIHCTVRIKYIKAMVMLGLSNDNSAIPIKGGNLSYCLSCTMYRVETSNLPYFINFKKA